MAGEQDSHTGDESYPEADRGATESRRGWTLDGVTERCHLTTRHQRSAGDEKADALPGRRAIAPTDEAGGICLRFLYAAFAPWSTRNCGGRSGLPYRRLIEAASDWIASAGEAEGGFSLFRSWADSQLNRYQRSTGSRRMSSGSPDDNLFELGGGRVNSQRANEAIIS